MTSVTPELKSFDDFREYSLWYLHDVGLTVPEILNAEHKVAFAPAKSEKVEFGLYAGRDKFRGPQDLPGGQWNGRGYLDILCNLVNIQGDTEFGSNEQQVGLWDSAPSDYDRKVLLSIMNEEFRHGWQMAYVALEVIGGDEGRHVAQSLLERRSGTDENKRLLGAFNVPITDWLGFYAFLEFMDRDGGSQLTLLQHSALAPLARSMVFMLREEQKHLRSGQQGFERILRAGKLPIELLQRYMNLYAPLGYDLHGGERSTNALIYFNLGLKGFYPTRESYLDGPPDAVVDAQLLADLRDLETRPAETSYQFINLNLDGPVREMNKELLNSITVSYYRRTLLEHFEQFNEIIREVYPAGTPSLVLPSLRWNRASPSIYAGQPYDIHGERIEDAAAHARYRAENLPSAEDRALLKELCRTPDWIAAPETDVYRTMTAVKSSDEILYPTTFGRQRRSRYTRRLSDIARERRAATQPKAQAQGVSLWQFMQDEAGSL
jgi:1,2-phenylacetyl-CoA epoxidase catalytic subunit